MAARVVDASVLVAVVSGEPHKRECDLAIAGYRLVAPRFCRLEAAIALARKAKRGICSRGQAREAFADIDSLSIVWLELDEASIGGAFSLALEIEHEVADCVYLSLARDLEFDLVTCDRKLAAAAARCGVRVFAPGRD